MASGGTDTTCWNNVYSPEWDDFIKHHALQDRSSFSSLLEFQGLNATRDAIIAGLNIHEELVSTLKSSPQDVQIISSYDTAGPLHFGNALVLRQLKAFLNMGCRVRIPLVDAEAVAVRGLTPDQAVRMAEETMIPVLNKAGFEKADIYVRSKVSGIANYMAQLSVAVSKEDQEEIYGHEMDFAKLYSNLYMAADLLRPQLEEGRQHTLVIYGIDEAPHMKVVNQIADKMGLRPISGLFSPLIPGLLNGKKMSKSLATSGANIALNNTPDEAHDKILAYNPVLPEGCMVKRLREYFLMRAIGEKEVCSLQCGSCKQESADAMKTVISHTRQFI